MVLISALLVLGAITGPTAVAASGDASPARAGDVTVTILSSNLANGATVGEWGLSAFVQVDGQCVLFDAGRYPDTVLRNAAVLGVDLSCVSDVVLSHFHFDHNTGLLPLLRDLRAKNPGAMQRVHVAEGFFLRRQLPQDDGYVDWNQMIAVRDTLEAAGVVIVEHSGPKSSHPCGSQVRSSGSTTSRNTVGRGCWLAVSGSRTTCLRARPSASSPMRVTSYSLGAATRES